MIMPDTAETHINNLIYNCDDILRGEYGERTQANIDRLMIELEGFKSRMQDADAASILSDKTEKGVLRVRGWLAANMSILTSAPSSSITNNSQAVATVSVDINQTIKQVQSSALDQADKDALELAISRMRNAAEQKNEKGFAEKMGKPLISHRRQRGLCRRWCKLQASLQNCFSRMPSCRR